MIIFVIFLVFFIGGLITYQLHKKFHDGRRTKPEMLMSEPEFLIVEYFRKNMQEIKFVKINECITEMELGDYSWKHCHWTFTQWDTGWLNNKNTDESTPLGRAAAVAMKQIGRDGLKYQQNLTLMVSARSVLEDKDFQFVIYRYPTSTIEFKALAREENGSWYNKDGILINWHPGITVEAAA